MSDPISAEPVAKAVIIVEDDEIVLKTLSLQLIDRGWDLFTTHSQQTALELCSNHPGAVVLIGTGMTGLDGVALARQLKESEADRIVIAMTGYPSLHQLIEGLYHETFDYLVKPFRIEQLDMVIDRAQREIKLRQENATLKNEVTQLRDSLAEALQPKPPAAPPPQEEGITPPPETKRQRGERDPNAIASYERQLRTSGPPIAPQRSSDREGDEEEKAGPSIPPGLESPDGS